MKLIILDRDGVINYDSKDFIKSPEEWIPIPGSLEAIVKLNQASFKVVVATNQSGIARSLFTLDTLDRIHEKMCSELKALGGHLDGIFFCPHGPEDNCDCRKPKTGLYHQIANHFNLDFNKETILAIGDSLRDLESAYSANCTPILVLTGNGQKTCQNLPDYLENINIYPSLSEAINLLISSLS